MKYTQHLPITIVQAIGIKWTKTSRGSKNATLRNQTPEAAAIHNCDASEKEGQLLLHKVGYGEDNQFHFPYNKVEIHSLENPFVIGCIKILTDEEGVKTIYTHDRSGGAPDRYSPPFEVVLKINQWIRVQYNGRFSGEDFWWYEKWTFNIGLFSNFTPRIFLSSSPFKTHSDLALLR